MRLFLSVFLVLLLTAPAPAAENSDESDESILIWATSLMHRAIVIDGHSDSPMRVVRGFDFTRHHEDEGHMDIPRLLEAGVDGQFLAAFLWPSQEPGYNGVAVVLNMLDAMHEIAARDERFVIATTAEEIEAAHKAGKVAGILAIEGGHAIVDSLAVLRSFHRLGVRYMTLTWMNHNNWADASGPDQSRYGNIEPHGGLTEFGREVIREMNRLGMIVDISHVSDDTFWDVMEVSTKPVIASHSCVYALTPHYRNLKDEMLKALAENGGVIGINFAPAYLSEEYDQRNATLWEEYRTKRNELAEKYGRESEAYQEAVNKLRAELSAGLWRVPISAVADHIEHAVKVAGIDHVGLGSDFDGIGDTPEKIDDCTDLVHIVVELRKRGWNEADLRKLLGENFLRVIRENTVPAQETHSPGQQREFREDRVIS